MENELKSLPAREIGVITAEIKDLCRQAQTMALLYAVEIGRRLVEAKSVLPYGTWGEWLRTEVKFGQSSANNFMRLFEEYGSSQISIFGASVDSQTFGNLPYTKALQLLAVPKEEREAFAKEVGAEDLSVKELKEAIAERDKAIKEAEEAKKREREIAERLSEFEEARKKSEAKTAEADKIRKELEDTRGLLEKAKVASDKLQEKLKKAESDPKIPPEKLAEIQKEAQEAAKKEADAKNGELLEKARKRAEQAEAEVKAAKDAERMAREQLEAAKKELKTASPKVNAFKTMFVSIQETANKMKAIIKDIDKEDPETAQKLLTALSAFGEGLK